jgi:hypothetical protein
MDCIFPSVLTLRDMSGGFGMTVLRQHLVQGGGNDATGTQEFHFELGFPAAVALCFSIEAREYEDPSTISARDEIRSWYGVILSRAWVASHSVVKLHSPEKAELHGTQRATADSRVGAVSLRVCYPSNCM